MNRLRGPMLLGIVMMLAGMVGAAQAATRYLDGALVSNCTGNYSIVSRNCTGSDGDAYTEANANDATNATIPGDFLNVRTAGGGFDGVYNISAAFSAWAGAATATNLNRVTIRKHPGDSGLPEFRPTSATNGQAVFYFNRRLESFVTLDGLDINCNNQAGFGVRTIYNSPDTSDAANGIWVHNGRVRGCTNSAAVSMNKFTGSHWVKGNEVDSSGIDVNLDHCMYISGPDNIIEYNNVHGCTASGIKVASGDGSNTANRNIVRYNRVWGNGLVSGTQNAVTVGEGSDSKVYGNLVYGNGRGGIAVFNGVNVHVYNNTLYGNGLSNPKADIFITSSGSTGTIVRNNIGIDNALGTTIVNNGTASTIGADNIIEPATASDHFVNAAANNFSLKSTSSAVGAGTAETTYCPTAGGVGCSIGAHQVPAFIGGTCTGNTFTVTLANSWTPVSGTTGFSATVNAGARTVSAVSVIGSNEYSFTISGAAIGAGEDCDVAYTPGTVTNCADIGRGSGAACSGHNQLAFADTNVQLTNISTAVPAYGLAVAKWYQINRAGLILQESENTATILPPGGSAIICMGARVTTADAPAQEYPLYVDLNAAGTYTEVTTTSTKARLAADPTLTVLATTLNGILSLGGTVEQDGSYITAAAGTSSVPTVAVASGNQYNKCYAITADESLSLTNTLDFRMRRGSTAFNTHTVTPRAVIGPGVATF